MARLETLIPGGTAENPIDFAGQAQQAQLTNTIDDSNAAGRPQLSVWTGSQADYNALVAAGNTDPNTIYFTPN